MFSDSNPIVVTLQLIGSLLFQYYGWVVVVAVFAYLIWQNRRRTKWVDTTDTILLLIEVAKDNEKKELSAEQMFASLHGILRPRTELRREGSLQEHVSFEIAAKGNQIQFYVWCPRHLKDFIESQIYAQYPSVHIREGADDYAKIEVGERAVYGTELELTNHNVVPIRTFTSFEVDPLAGITAVLAKLDETGEEAWIQILARPIDDSWQEAGKRYIDRLKGGGGRPLAQVLLELPAYIAQHAVSGLFTPPGGGDKKAPEKKELSTGQTTTIKAVEEKIGKLGYDVSIRIAYIGPKELAKPRLQALVGGFKQFNTTNLNGFTTRKYYNTPDFLKDYESRFFFGSGFILNIEELASLYHLPHKSVETPNMVWTTSKTSEPPANLPSEAVAEQGEEISLFAQTNYRGSKLRFGIKRADRGRHMYIVGQTGTGKSFLLELLTLSDIYHNQGFAIIDPHGDFATDMLKYIPEHRIQDVVYFNPADYEHPIAFNPMEVIDENLKNHIASEIIGVLKRMFGFSWGPRLEYILRYTLLALLDTPDSTMLSITRMLTEKDFRKQIVANVKDPVVRKFWQEEFASWNQQFAAEAISPVLNKVGAFTQNPLIRNIIGQTKSAFNLRQMMDEGKILVVNLSRGQVGEDNAAILGALMVTKIQLAAMSRADMPMDQRRPFYLYVDEFQNFATDSFAVILSEARKYGLNLTVANQYVAQMEETVRDAVFGNVGTMACFRVGPSDATVLGKYFEPAFEAADLTKLHNQHIFLSMMINGEKAIPFSATTLRMPEPEQDFTGRIIQLSNERYASDRQKVTDDINTWSGGSGASPTGQPAPSHVTAIEQNPNSFLGNLRNPEHASSGHTNDNAGDKRSRDDRNRNQSQRRDDRSRGGRNDNRRGDRNQAEHRPSQPAAQNQPPAAPAATPTATSSAIEPGQEITLR